MDDLGEPGEHLREQFRFLPSSLLSSPSDSPDSVDLIPTQPLPNNVNLLAASSTYGYAFAAVKNFLYVYTLSSLRKKPSESDPSPVAKVDLQEYILGLDLVNQDTSLVVHTRKDPDGSPAILSSLTVSQLVKGNVVRESWLPNTPCVSYAITNEFDRPILAIVSPEQELRILKSNSQLWASPTEEREAPICLAFSLDGSRLAVGTRRGSVKLHDTDTGSICGSVKEVESGWIPVSVAFIASDDLFVCYQNEMLLSHVVWRISNGQVQTHFPLGDLFYPYISDDSLAERQVYSYCKLVQGWNIAVISNSCSEDVKLISLGNDNPEDGWIVWSLDEGMDITFPLDEESNQCFPTGFVLDYSDNNPIPNAPGRPTRNPMPRFVAITTDYQLWSVSIVDDAEGAVCNAIKDSIPLPSSNSISQGISAAPELEPEIPAVSDRGFIESNDPEAEPKSVSTESESSSVETEAEIDVSAAPIIPPIGAAPAFLTALNPTSSLFGKSAFQNSTSPFGAPPSFQTNTPETSTFANASKESAWGKSEPAETKPPVTMFGQTQTNDFLSNFSFGGASTGATEQRNNVTSAPKPSAAASVPLQLANEPDPVNQLKSILIEMEEEMTNIGRQKDQAVAMVEQSKVTVERNLKDIQESLSDLMKIDSEAWKREKESRKEVDRQVKEVIHNGHIYEELNLLNALLSENDDARPLPNDAQEQDKKLNKKEMEIMDRLEEVERKIEEKIPYRNRRGGKKKLEDWNSPSEMSQHIYSSLSLQGVRIKRVKAMLESLEVQHQVSMEEDENRVANSGLSRSRLRRLSQFTSGSVLGSSSASKRKKTPTQSASPSLASAEKKLAESVQNMSLRARNSTPLSYRGQERDAETVGVRADTAAILRKLAMRKGRERVTVRKRAPKTSNGIMNGTTRFEKKEEFPSTSFTRPSAPESASWGKRSATSTTSFTKPAAAFTLYRGNENNTSAPAASFAPNPTLAKEEEFAEKSAAPFASSVFKTSPPPTSVNHASFAKPPMPSPTKAPSPTSTFAAFAPSASPKQTPAETTPSFTNFAKTTAAASFDIREEPPKKRTLSFGEASPPVPKFGAPFGAVKAEEELSAPINPTTTASKSSSDTNTEEEEAVENEVDPAPELERRDSKRRWSPEPSNELKDREQQEKSELPLITSPSPGASPKSPFLKPDAIIPPSTAAPSPPVALPTLPGLNALSLSTPAVEKPIAEPKTATASSPDTEETAAEEATAKPKETTPPPAEKAELVVAAPQSGSFSFSAAAATSSSSAFGFGSSFGKTSFGGTSAPTSGVFASNNATPAFSSLAIAAKPDGTAGTTSQSSASSSSSLFGGSGGTFGQSSAFGQASAIGQASAFGQSSSSLFGKSQSASSLFGQSSSASSASAFGQSASASTMSAFGQSVAASSMSAFGQSSSIGQASGFGQASSIGQSSSFGQSSTIGQPAAFGQNSAFGQTSTIGKPSGFGQASSIGNGGSGFGGGAAFGAPSAFGAQASSGGFGSAFSSAPLFGGASAGSAPLFGGATPTKSNGSGNSGFGAASQGSPFGNVASSGTSSGFGGAGGGSPFGAMAQQNQGGFGSGFGGAAAAGNGFGGAGGGGTGFGGAGQQGSGFGAAGAGGQQGSGFGGFGQQQPQTQANQFKTDAFTRRRA